MSTHCEIYKVVATMMIVLALVAGCVAAKPTATVVPPTQTPIPPTPAPTPLATKTPVPTPTSAPPTMIPTKEPTATPAQRSGADPGERVTLVAKDAAQQDLADQQQKDTRIKGRIDVGGHHLFINCDGAGSPTVILEAGWGDAGDTWSLVQPEIAQHTRVCSYDRAGLGNSEAGPEPRDMLRVVNELGALLENAVVTGPYILVGHSWGGLYARLFADLHPQDVVGLVLVDSSHPDQFRRSLAVLPPESPDDSESTMFYRDWFSSSAQDPTLEMDARLFEPGSLGNLPLVVLTVPRKERADDFPVELSAQFDQIWVQLNTELAQLSSNSAHVLVEDSSHFIQHDRPDLVINAILQVLHEDLTGF